MDQVVRQLKIALSLLVGVVLLGTVGYRLAGMSWIDALYQTAITITTVGYTDAAEPYDVKVFTIIMVAVGTLTIAVLISLITGAVVELQIREVLGRRKVQNKVDKLNRHMIVCGYGRLGRTIAGELERRGTPFVVLEQDGARVEFAAEHNHLALLADATEEESLTAAGIQRASGLLTTLGSDAANVYVTLTAKQMQPGLKVVAISLDENAGRKLRAAGADEVVSPYQIGGTWMAQSVTSPAAADFLKMATGVNPLNFFMDEQTVGSGSTLAGKRLRETPIRGEFGVIVVAVRKHEGDLVTNPEPDLELSAGDVLVSLGEREKLDALKTLAHG